MIAVAVISTIIGAMLGAAGTVALEVWAYCWFVGRSLSGNG